MRCRNCGDETLLENVVKQYQGKARTPVYLYSGLILFVFISLFWLYWQNNSKKKNAEYTEHPMTGDVYTIRKKERNGDTYYFLRIQEVDKDSVKAYRNEFNYGGFVSSFSPDDYFDQEDTLFFSKKELKRLLEYNEIVEIDRGYSPNSDFNKIR